MLSGIPVIEILTLKLKDLVKKECYDSEILTDVTGSRSVYFIPDKTVTPELLYIAFTTV